MVGLYGLSVCVCVCVVLSVHSYSAVLRWVV